MRGWGEGGEGVVRMAVMKRVVRRCGNLASCRRVLCTGSDTAQIEKA